MVFRVPVFWVCFLMYLLFELSKNKQIITEIYYGIVERD